MKVEIGVEELTKALGELRQTVEALTRIVEINSKLISKLDADADVYFAEPGTIDSGDRP